MERRNEEKKNEFDARTVQYLRWDEVKSRVGWSESAHCLVVMVDLTKHMAQSLDS
jgi:hypothetical protein